MAPHRKPTARRLSDLRARYDAGEPVTALAKSLSVTTTTFRRWRTDWGWPARQGRRSATKATAKAARTAPANAALADKIVAAAQVGGMGDSDYDVPKAVDAAIRACGMDLDVLLQDKEGLGTEQRARALASITRTLGILYGLKAQIENERTGRSTDDGHDDPPVDVAELREELARRLHRLGETGDAS